MRFAILGPLAVLRDDHEPTLIPGAKERLLLAILTSATPGAVSTDRLLETLWDGKPPVTGRKSLQAHVVRLRSALEPDRPKGSSGRYVVRRGPGYALSVEREAVDALLFGVLTTRGRARLAADDAGGALEQLTSAMDLWRGEPYADWPDATFAEVERRRLAEVRSSAVEGTLEARLALGQTSEVVPELERLVAEEPLRETWWSLLMLALYRGGRQGDALAAGRRARALLADELGTDPGPGLRAVETAVLTQDPSLDLPLPRVAAPIVLVDGEEPPSLAVTVEGCPYKGLAAYQATDAALFHGRARLVAALVRRLVDASLLVVSGPSGAGKSSVVRAGLVPTLADGALPGSRAWRPLVISPGRRPVDTISELTGESAPETPVVLVCDQFEQLWAPGNDAAERTAFLDALLGLLDDGVVARCIAVVRGDHLGRLAEHEAWTDRIAGAIVLVPPMTDSELREVVSEPAGAAGLTVEPELLDLVVADVVGQVGALPLLSAALVGTWERRQGNRLTVGGYLASGGVDGALTRTAEAAYAALDDHGRQVAQRLLVRLADSEDGGVLVRRAVPLAELALDGSEGPARRAVMESFVSRRLLSVDGDHLEVAHEALLTSWPRLARWLEDDVAGRAVRRHLAPTALEWDRAGRPIDELYRGARLTPALDWAAHAGSDLTPVEAQFLEASRELADAELREARQRVRRTRRLAVGLAVGMVAALVAAGLAVRYQRDADARTAEAEVATAVADANRLAALSTTVGPLDLSLLLAAESVDIARTREAEDALLAALVEHRRAIRMASIGDRAELATLANGRTWFVAIPGGDARVVTFRMAGAREPKVVFDNLPSYIDGSPTDDQVVVGYWDGAEDTGGWVIGADGTQLSLDEADLEDGLLDIAFAPDGRSLLAVLATPTGPTVRRLELAGYDWVTVAGADPITGGGADGAAIADDASAVVVWTQGDRPKATRIDLRRRARTPIATARRAAVSLGFVPLPRGAAQLWDDGALTVYDGAGQVVQTLDAHRGAVNDVLVASSGTWAASAGDDGAIVLWDVDRGTGQWSRRETLTGHAGQVAGLEVDPTGRTLYSAGTDGRVIAWNITPDAGFGSSYPGLGDRWITNTPQLVGAGSDALLVAPTRPVSPSRGGGGIEAFGAPDASRVNATFIDPSTGRVVDEVYVGTTADETTFGSSVAISPDGSKVAVTSGFSTAVLDARTHEVLGRVTLPTSGLDVLVGGRLRHEVPEPVWGSGWTRDGERLILGADVNGLVVVDPTTWQVERRVEIGGVQTIEPSPDGRILAVASLSEPQVWLLDAGTLDTVRTLVLPASTFAFDLSFSPDGRWLAAGGDGGYLSVFDSATWRLAQPPVLVDNQFVQQLEWLRDGRTVVASGRDGTVSLYDVRRGLIRARPLPGSDELGAGYTHMIPGPSEELVVLSGERAGRRYPMRPARWLAEACAIAARDLTRAEWNRYLPDRPYERTCTPLL